MLLKVGQRSQPDRREVIRYFNSVSKGTLLSSSPFLSRALPESRPQHPPLARLQLIQGPRVLGGRCFTLESSAGKQMLEACTLRFPTPRGACQPRSRSARAGHEDTRGGSCRHTGVLPMER
ncbi:hypothetical protein DR999_PMT11145 [Platysternon megacephalum]|uniref:Uncharacterized protein n=1 Tax=Platysternon megacephalum TaxID=55544 RepID=A0A4D9E8B0_9SAUR|nr:hypothetical protein DR999_PMT11145 [Platysternon megacephalum]